MLRARRRGRLAVELVAGEGNGPEVFVVHLDPGRVVALVELGPDLQPRRGRGVGDQVHHHLVAREGTPLPVHRDRREESMLDLYLHRRERNPCGTGVLTS